MKRLNCLWPPAPAQLNLGKNEVHVWCAALDQTASRVSQLAQLLSIDESERAARYKFDHHRRHFIVGRGLLRAILGRYLQIHPDQLGFDYGPQGKPSLTGLEDRFASLQFNLSHSGGLALYAITRNREIGVDIEEIRRLKDMDGIAKRFFSSVEQAAFLSLPYEIKPTGFFNCWTRKEAFIKAIGDGLSYSLSRFDVSLKPGDPANLLHIQDDPLALTRWSLYHLTPAAGYVGALVVADQHLVLSCWSADLV